MNLLFDTNIIMSIVRDKTGYNLYQYLNPESKDIFISFANVAEIESIAFQNGWGKTKMNQLSFFFEEARIIDISDLLLKTYIDIDAFSQRNHPDYEHYSFKTPRNMGKNDLWTVRRCDYCNCLIIKSFTCYNRRRF